jgi:hypothetical protein
VAGRPAYAATIEVANIDEVHVTPRARTSRIQIVLVRAPQDELYEPTELNVPKQRFPVVVLAAYSNMPADFANGLEDFHGLLQRLAIGGKTGFTLELAPAAPHDSAPSPAPAPPASPSM